MREKRKQLLESTCCVNITPAPRKPGIVRKSLSFLFSGIKKGFKKLFFEDKMNIKGTASRTPTFLGVVFTFIWALKRRACPLVVFVDDSPAADKTKEHS